MLTWPGSDVQGSQVAIIEDFVRHASSNYNECSSNIVICCRNIVRTEGVQALFKGLGPNLIGVAPSRYFCSLNYIMHQYSSAKESVVHKQFC